MDMYMYINIDRDVGKEISYKCIDKDIAYTSAHTCKTFKVHFECQPGEVCTEIHGFQTAVLHVRTAKILKEPVNKKWQMDVKHMMCMPKSTWYYSKIPKILQQK